MFKTVLIANRGEIACRVNRTLRTMGVRAVAVYSEADVDARHVSLADEAVFIGPAPVVQSYLNVPAILEAARKTGAQAIHPGYGFLSENPGFADACEAAGIAFIGPTARQMREFGLKHTARALAALNGVPLLPGTELLDSPEEAIAAAKDIGYPVILKATAGGGGIGMRVCRSEQELAEAFDVVRHLGEANFKAAGVYLERFVADARHIEVQIFGDGMGHILALGERDCSSQRRNQKVIEETPAPHLSEAAREKLCDAARRLGRAVSYRSAGTVEFVLDAQRNEFFFLEVNTRLQVEHGVTEQVAGIDLVEWMVRLAAGDRSMLAGYRHQPRGHSIQGRLYAEDPAKGFQPSSGLLTHAAFPDDARVDGWVSAGTTISPYYDPLLAKVIVHGGTRDDAMAKMRAALYQTKLAGIETNLDYLRQVLDSPMFVEGRMTTRALAEFDYAPSTIDVLSGGNFTTVQDYPGRIGYWDVGVPPSGPMDHLSFRIGNRVVGNDEGAAGLECTVTGPTLRFNRAATICLTGAEMRATLDGRPVPFGTAIEIEAGSTFQLGKIDGPGCRTYLLVLGGIDVPDYLGSRSTFTLGQFGGHGGRALRTGDVLHLPARAGASRTQPQPSIASSCVSPSPASIAPLRGNRGCTLPEREGCGAILPTLTKHWRIGVLDGPHGSPDFFLADDIGMLFATAWEVHFNSARTGVRLVGPKPRWARPDGGEAGLHPSNIHDNAYAIGTIDFTGDMPIILGPDGPSLGGFVCPATIVQAELWKIGQLAPGDTVRFVRLTTDDATEMEREQDAMIAGLNPLPPREGREEGRHATIAAGPDKAMIPQPADSRGIASVTASVHATLPRVVPGREGSRSAPPVYILRELPDTPGRPRVVYRRSGDRYLLVEYGPIVLDLSLRLRIHALMQWVRRANLAGVIDLTPGIRSLQVHYDSRVLSLDVLLDALVRAEGELPPVEAMEVDSRIVHMPLSWEDAATLQAIDRYMKGVRDDAPWCPSNIEFIRRINGLGSIDDVKRIVFESSYLVLGLGDVYLGAPVATPLDPRHRLVTTKYNPARTWTPENAVGIGGAYLCIYGMEGPGGYQFVGRTAQVWNTYRQTRDFNEGRPWLLRFFDQIRFYPVSHEELLQFRRDFLQGRVELKVEPTRFRLRDYLAWLKSIEPEARAFKASQQAAFNAERAEWERRGEFQRSASSESVAPLESESAVPEGMEAIESPMGAGVWKVLVSEGQIISAGDELAVLEAMKMETAIASPRGGRITKVLCKTGQVVKAGQPLMWIGDV
jgi:urea carboxylase